MTTNNSAEYAHTRIYSRPTEQQSLNTTWRNSSKNDKLLSWFMLTT